MTGFLEVWRPTGAMLVPLEGQQISVGRDSTNTVALVDDAKVSRLHAVIEPLAGGWVLRDLNSRNGTTISGERVLGDRPLRDGEEVVIGSSRLVLRADAPTGATTISGPPPPDLTPRERDVIVALFASARSGEAFTEPASTREMAAALFVSEAAIKQHLLRLYDKFGIHEGERRRVRLANEALRRSVVTLAEVRRQASDG